MDLAYRVAFRFLTGGTSPQDLIKSLLGVVKRGGRWASEAQAKFLWNVLSRMSDPVAEAWGRPYMGDDPNALAVSLMAIDERFGRTDPSKIRYYAYLFVVDGAGVKAMARGKVEHPKAGESSARLVGAGPTEFERSGEAPVLYDKHRENEAKNERARENQPLIDRIRQVSDFRNNSFLQDMVALLEEGRSLSPGQLGVVRKYVPDVEVGDSSEWVALYEKGIGLVEDRIYEPIIKFFRSGRATALDKDTVDWYLDKIPDAWRTFKARPRIYPDMDIDGFNFMESWSREAGIKHIRGYTGWGDALARLSIAAKKGQKAPRTALKAVPVAAAYIAQLERFSASRMTSHLEKEFGGDPPKDPFDVFK